MRKDTSGNNRFKADAGCMNRFRAESWLRTAEDVCERASSGHRIFLFIAHHLLNYFCFHFCVNIKNIIYPSPIIQSKNPREIFRDASM
jgi:hypothetical protein